jgi:hypothetical protein
VKPSHQDVQVLSPCVAVSARARRAALPACFPKLERRPILTHSGSYGVDRDRDSDRGRFSTTTFWTFALSRVTETINNRTRAEPAWGRDKKHKNEAAGPWPRRVPTRSPADNLYFMRSFCADSRISFHFSSLSESPKVPYVAISFFFFTFYIAA